MKFEVVENDAPSAASFTLMGTELSLLNCLLSSIYYVKKNWLNNYVASYYKHLLVVL